MNCPRCDSEYVVEDDDGRVTCKHCNTIKYWQLHRERNENKLGDWH